MQKKIILFFICLVTLPILIIYMIVSNIFIKSTQEDMTTIYAANIREVGKNIDVILGSALDLSIYPLMEQNFKAFLTASIQSSNYKKIKKNAGDILLSMPYGYSTGIHGVSITNMEQDSLRTNINTKLTSSDMKEAGRLNGSPYWDYSKSGLKNGYLYLTRLLKNPSNISQHVGYVKLSISCNKIQSSILQNQQDNQTSYFIITKDNRYIIRSDNNNYLENQRTALTYHQLTKLATSKKGSTIIGGHIVSAYPLGRTEFIIYSITKPEVLSAVKHSFYLNMAIIFIIVLIFSLLLSIAFSKIITTPLERFGYYMKSISNEDFTVRYPVKGSDEISVMAEHFNNMAERLNFLYTEVYMGELKLKQSQLDILQNQINPHFLYNTLDTIYWMSRMGDNENVSIMVSNMSRMMRLTLAPKTNDKILLSQELEHLSCYINIQKIRYGKKVTFEQQCAEEITHEYVLSFLLQPLVENALVHGLSNCLKGTVKISIYEQEDTIYYEVSNDGEPINEEEIGNILNAADKSMKGFALRNINERIKLKYGDNYSLTCYREAEFSVFKIVQPKEAIHYDKNTNCG
ncbi:sensor histidine kinase [Anaerocolumna sp. MB42-C2]|uniref:sensor histidine kinase n=1 Tax=Anaerocolumna sp. MB42-C2 TaxID=3070997 RepID=UPI0027E0F85D|nr:histidine kinase [Anaerocolumna sp. MB42-C2]WMJ86911.1 histidine kinase [Anaerocolumna sp. MB42-C2]